ncbi:MAG: hypothetical protein R2837_07915 [Aliarcobacter sp.]
MLRKTALISQFIVVWTFLRIIFKGATITYDELLFVAFILGFAGASFAVALPQAWSNCIHQNYSSCF